MIIILKDGITQRGDGSIPSAGGDFPFLDASKSKNIFLTVDCVIMVKHNIPPLPV